MSGPGTLSWRHWPNGAPWDAGLRAELLNHQSETVGEVWCNTGRKYGWRALKPAYWFVMDDPEARAACPERTGWLDARKVTESWGGWYANRRNAAFALTSYLHKRSIGLFGLDDLEIPIFNTTEKVK